MNKLYYGDNLDVMQKFIRDLGGLIFVTSIRRSIRGRTPTTRYTTTSAPKTVRRHRPSSTHGPGTTTPTIDTMRSIQKMTKLICSMIFLNAIGFSSIAFGYQTGFNVDVVGLTGERRTSAFGVMRKGCPHKGVDYSSSQRPKDFTAGLYGKVVEPEESGYATIAVLPFNASGYTVQYLHTSAKYVAVGDIVQPWTIIGATGDTAPPTNPADGIHLHLQIQSMLATPSQTCWNGREFVDPETWNISNPLIGAWRNSSTDVVQGVTIEQISTLQLFGDNTGSRVVGEMGRKLQYVSPRTGTLYTVDSQFKWPGQVVGRQKHSLQIELFAGTCAIIMTPSRPATCTALPAHGDLQLQASNTLTSFNFADPTMGKVTWTKPSSSTLSNPSELINAPPLANATKLVKNIKTRKSNSQMISLSLFDPALSVQIKSLLQSVQKVERKRRKIKHRRRK